MLQPTVAELHTILAHHRKWLDGDQSGRRADLRGADLSGAKGLAFQIPQQGPIVVYKKLQSGAIATLEIPADAKRTGSIVGRKCRAEFVRVLLIERDGESVPDGNGIHDTTLVYRVGEIVNPDRYDDDVRIECTHGIHFFLSRTEAEEYTG